MQYLLSETSMIGPIRLNGEMIERMLLPTGTENEVDFVEEHPLTVCYKESSKQLSN